MRRLFILPVVTLLAVGGGIAAQSTTVGPPSFHVEPSWPTIPNGWIYGEVSSIAVDRQERVWILHRPLTVPQEQRSKAAPPVTVYDSDGHFVRSWGGSAAGYDWPEREHGIYIDPKGFVWIGGNNGYGTPAPPGDSDDMLLKFTQEGKFILQVGHRNQSQGNADTANLHQPADGFYYARTNEMFVADGYGNNRVIVLDADTGKFKRMWGAFGNKPETPPSGNAAAAAPSPDGPSQFGLVHSIKVSTDGYVYVADRSNRRIQVFTTDGKFVTQKVIGTTGQTAAGLAFSPDAQQQFLYVANLGDSQILVLNRKTMGILNTFGQRGNKPGDFNILHHLAADSKGNIYTAEIGQGRRAQKFVPTR
jgi:DNA-binding beta-propeller fold protein YncE